MQLRINDLQYNLQNLARQLGYIPDRATETGELSAARRFGGDYPRFHLYIRKETGVVALNLHLDRKKSVLPTGPAHGGEYEGETVAKEMERIREIIYS